jgi:hypothetical protein
MVFRNAISGLAPIPRIREVRPVKSLSFGIGTSVLRLGLLVYFLSDFTIVINRMMKITLRVNPKTIK